MIHPPNEAVAPKLNVRNMHLWEDDFVTALMMSPKPRPFMCRASDIWQYLQKQWTTWNQDSEQFGAHYWPQHCREHLH